MCQTNRDIFLLVGAMTVIGGISYYLTQVVGG
jgi:hypothetical protein